MLLSGVAEVYRERNIPVERGIGKVNSVSSSYGIGHSVERTRTVIGISLNERLGSPARHVMALVTKNYLRWLSSSLCAD